MSRGRPFKLYQYLKKENIVLGYMSLLSEFQTCPIDGMCALCLCHGGFMADFVLSSKVSFFTTKTTDYFMDKFKFISMQVVGDHLLKYPLIITCRKEREWKQ